jgi:hypothetical protein
VAEKSARWLGSGATVYRHTVEPTRLWDVDLADVLGRRPGAPLSEHIGRFEK